MMELLVETILVILKMIYYWIKAVVMTIVPASLQAKDIAGNIVLVTGAGTVTLIHVIGIRFPL